MSRRPFLNLFQGKNRTCLSNLPEDTDVLYIISQVLVEGWWKSVRKPTRCRSVSSVVNSALLCPLGVLMFTFASVTKEDSKLITLMWPSEWQVMQKPFVVDYIMKITRTKVEDVNSS